MAIEEEEQPPEGLKPIDPDEMETGGVEGEAEGGYSPAD